MHLFLFLETAQVPYARDGPHAVSLILNDYIHVRIQIEVCICKESFLSHLSTLMELHEKKLFFTLEKSMLKISKASNLYFLVVCFLQCFYSDLFSYTTALSTLAGTLAKKREFLTKSFHSLLNICNKLVLKTQQDCIASRLPTRIPSDRRRRKTYGTSTVPVRSTSYGIILLTTPYTTGIYYLVLFVGYYKVTF